MVGIGSLAGSLRLSSSLSTSEPNRLRVQHGWSRKRCSTWRGARGSEHAHIVLNGVLQKIKTGIYKFLCIWYRCTQTFSWMTLDLTDTKFAADYSYTKIIVVCPSVCLSVCYGRSAETIWPRDVRDCIYSHWKLEARTRQSLWTAVIALATDTNTSFLDRLYKK